MSQLFGKMRKVCISVLYIAYFVPLVFSHCEHPSSDGYGNQYGYSRGDNLTTSTVHRCVQNALAELETVLNATGNIHQFCQTTVLNYSPTSNPIGKPSNCADLKYGGFQKSGVYTIYPKPWLKGPKQIDVYCDMETDGGGWIVFQRRKMQMVNNVQRQLNFTRDWKSYAQGFGNLTNEFWLGNENIHFLTMQENVALRIDLEHYNGDKAYARYHKFVVANKEHRYKLTADNYIGTAGNSMTQRHVGQGFATIDRDTQHTCSEKYRGGWWYSSTDEHCYSTNLNGEFVQPGIIEWKGINWYHWFNKYITLKGAEMKLRPSAFLSP